MENEMFQRLPAATQRLLRERNFPTAVLDHLMQFPPDAGVLLVGSYAEGMAHRASDLDFLVLLEGDERVAQAEDIAGTGHPSTLASEALVFAGEVEINFEVVHLQTVANLEHVTRNLALFSAETGHSGGLPILQILEMRFLSRLRAGIALRGHARIEQWRKSFQVNYLSEYWTAMNFIGAMDYLEDASSRTQRKADSLTCAVMSRIAAEGLVLSSLAYKGFVLHDLKLAPKYAARLRESNEVVSPALDEMTALLFPETGSLGHAYFQFVGKHAARHFHYLEADGHMPGVTAFLQRYGHKRWQLDTSFLTQVS